MSTIFSMIKSIRYLDFSSLKREKDVTSIRKNWGREVRKDRKFNLISIYHKLISEDDDAGFVDENTWNDLNMDSVFSMIDRNVSAVGSQYLYSLLHRYEDDSQVLSARFKQCQYFIKNSAIREEILINVHKLRHDNAYYIPNLIFKGLPERPRYYFFFYLLSFTMLLSLILIYFNTIFLFIALALALINLLINELYGRKITGFLVDISYLNSLLRVGIKLSELDGQVEQIEELQKLKNFATTMNKKIGWLIIDKSRLNELSAAFVDYLNYFCLFNIVSFVHSIQYISSNHDKLEKIYCAIGSLDATISIASYMTTLPQYCLPEFNREKIIDVDKIYHPLLNNPISNDFHIRDKSVLITGSNMAGKTTFIKTIGLNIILGQTISICLAQRAVLPGLIVKSSIKRADDINENKSYYFKEIESVLQFIKLGSGQDDYLFLIDEIFRGTNTIERIAAATSVLRYLSKNSITFVTTHDVELQHLLAEDYDMHHFAEQVDSGIHSFDYLIKAGPTSSRNAIKLLQLKGYPHTIIEEANDLAEQFSVNKTIGHMLT